MTHLPYILAAYALFAVVVAVLAVGAGLRLRQARTRLKAVDPRGDQRSS
jgi:ABC-type sulfate transport system permease component